MMSKILAGHSYESVGQRPTSKGSPGVSVYLLASFDLCDFTALKIKYPHRWLEVLVNILHMITEKSFGMKFWKFNGDDFLFYKDITNALEIAEIIEDAYVFLRYMEFATRSALRDDSFVSVAGGVWIANMTNINPLEGGDIDYTAPNFLLRDYRLNTGQDFVGINVDEGFRMCQMAYEDCIVIDPKIVYMFSSLYKQINKRDYCNRLLTTPGAKIFRSGKKRRPRMRIKNRSARGRLPLKYVNNVKKKVKAFAQRLEFVEYGSLKGVPGGSTYPIIRYVDDERDSLANEGSTRPADNFNRLKQFFQEANTYENVCNTINSLDVYKRRGSQLMRPLIDRPVGSRPPGFVP